MVARTTLVLQIQIAGPPRFTTLVALFGDRPKPVGPETVLSPRGVTQLNKNRGEPQSRTNITLPPPMLLPPTVPVNSPVLVPSLPQSYASLSRGLTVVGPLEKCSIPSTKLPSYANLSLNALSNTRELHAKPTTLFRFTTHGRIPPHIYTRAPSARRPAGRPPVAPVHDNIRASIVELERARYGKADPGPSRGTRNKANVGIPGTDSAETDRRWNRVRPNSSDIGNRPRNIVRVYYTIRRVSRRVHTGESVVENSSDRRRPNRAISARRSIASTDAVDAGRTDLRSRNRSPYISDRILLPGTWSSHTTSATCAVVILDPRTNSCILRKSAPSRPKDECIVVPIHHKIAMGNTKWMVRSVR